MVRAPGQKSSVLLAHLHGRGAELHNDSPKDHGLQVVVQPGIDRHAREAGQACAGWAGGRAGAGGAWPGGGCMAYACGLHGERYYA